MGYAAVGIAFVLSLTSICPESLAAQQRAPANDRTILGCWKLEPGRFSVIGRVGVDPGQTLLPSLVELDTLPGKSWSGDPVGRLARALTRVNRSRYGEGYYVLSKANTLHILWSNGYVGMEFVVRIDSSVMHGVADAFTDYGGQEEASLVMRRAECE